MSNPLITAALPQLDELVLEFEELLRRSKYNDFSDITSAEASEFVTAGLAAIHRIAGSNSSYYSDTKETIKKLSPYHPTLRIPSVGGAVKALRNAVASGYLTRIEELVHADMFSDFLEMARYLLNEDYKDPSAVLTGGVLEEHLRKLCVKNGIPTEITDTRGTAPKKADTMNSDLVRANVYSKLDLKSVTSWLDLRNKAAHGKYDEYTKEQVSLMLEGVTNFITRIPA